MFSLFAVFYFDRTSLVNEICYVLELVPRVTQKLQAWQRRNITPEKKSGQKTFEWQTIHFVSNIIYSGEYRDTYKAANERAM